jgi:hypothetical protein
MNVKKTLFKKGFQLRKTPALALFNYSKVVTPAIGTNQRMGKL